MKLSNPQKLLFPLWLCVTACSISPEAVPVAADAPLVQDHAIAAKFLPPEGRILSIIGQDLEAVRDYTAAGKYPVPGGITNYFSLYLVRDPEKAYAGIGLDNDLNPVDVEADWWGSGPHSSWKAAREFEGSVLAIGLDLTEKYAENGLARLVAGEFDPEIDKLGGFLKKVGKPVFLRIGYEFDGVWNEGYHNAAKYTDAWRRIVDRLREQKVDNVAYVWQGSSSPADDAIEGFFEPDLAQWYPGDKYVDWIGCSWFLLLEEAGTHEQVHTTQRQLLDQLLAFARKHNKPMMIAEAAPQGYFIEKKINANIADVVDGPAGEGVVDKRPEEIWNEWFVPFFAFVHENADVIRAVAYINCYWDQQPMWGPPYDSGLWGDSRVQADPLISERWLGEMKRTAWLHGGPSLFTRLGNDPQRTTK